MNTTPGTIKKGMSKEQRLFCRKHPMTGIYGICHNRKQIQIKDREVFATEDEDLIKIFENDPEIVGFVAPVGNEAAREVLDYNEMSDEELLELCKARDLCNRKVKVKNTVKKDLIAVLKDYDKDNSAPENDQGEQTSEIS